MANSDLTKRLLRTIALYIRNRARGHLQTFVSDGKEIERLEAVREKPADIYTPAYFENDTPDLDLSIIVPVYNVEKYLDECLASLLQDKVSVTFEVIAVNDGSTDNSEKILTIWKNKSPNLKVINRVNGGLSAARNTGINASRGRYIAFVDSDDVFPITSIVQLLMALEFGPEDYASGAYQRVAENGTPLGDSTYVSEMMVPWGRVYRRKVWSDIRFPVGCWYEDLISPYLIESRYHGVDVNVEPYQYRNRSGSIVNSTSIDPRAIDHFWLIGYMLSECRRLGIQLNQNIFDKTIVMMGPLLVSRSRVLNTPSLYDLFIACCEIIRQQPEFDGLHTSLGEQWEDVVRALWAGNFCLWASGVAVIALDKKGGVSLGRRTILWLLNSALRFR